MGWGGRQWEGLFPEMAEFLRAETERALLELFRDRATQGSAVVVVTHSEAVAASADRVVRLVDGRIVDG